MARQALSSSVSMRQIVERQSNDKEPSGHLRTGRTTSHDPVENEQLRTEVALYIGSMASELAAMARSANYDVLAYFLEMARMEARLRLADSQPAETPDGIVEKQPMRA